MICRHCFNENVEGAEVCAFCGDSLLIAAEEQPVGKVYCTQCGTENLEDALLLPVMPTPAGRGPPSAPRLPALPSVPRIGP